MTTPDRVADLLNEDDRLTAEEKQALADLFRTAYDSMLTDGQEAD